MREGKEAVRSVEGGEGEGGGVDRGEAGGVQNDAAGLAVGAAQRAANLFGEVRGWKGKE